MRKEYIYHKISLSHNCHFVLKTLYHRAHVNGPLRGDGGQIFSGCCPNRVAINESIFSEIDELLN